MARPARKEAVAVTLVVPGDAAELSPNRRMHLRTRAARIKRWREAAAWIAKQDLGWKKKPRRVRLHWCIRRWQSLDHAQLHGTLCLKAVEDGLVDAGIVPDDSPKWVEWGTVEQECGGEWRYREQVAVTIEVLEEI